MTAVGVVLLQTFSCLGLGAAALRALRLDAEMTPGERWTLSFAVGFGILGWLMFPLGVAGYLGPLALTALLSIGAFGVVFLRRRGGAFAAPTLDRVGVVLIALLGMILAFDLAEALAPPADADTLAYHFSVPKQFVDAGRISFILEPLVGAVPFLVQMTYVPVLALGGELALTLWTMISGWAPGALLYVLCRRHLGGNWSLALTIVFLTTPAVIYGGGTGQVETRMALFVMVAAWAVARALETGNMRYAALAGIGSGFFAAAKYTGLLFVAVAGVVVIFQRQWFRAGAAFTVAVAAAEFQWYAWNGIHTGDPVFPALFQWLGRHDLEAWTTDYDLAFKKFLFSVENPLPQSLQWLLLFPFKVTVDFSGLPDAGRVGFGPYGLLVAPFALSGMWRHRQHVVGSRLFAYAVLALLFYMLWFFFGGSQRIRHLLPVLPLFLMPVTVAAARFAAAGRYRGPLFGALGAVIVLQAGIHGLYALNYFRYLSAGADREAFLARNVVAYVAVPWINANLNQTDLLYIANRELRYLLTVPNFLGTDFQALVELHPELTDLRKLHGQLRRAGITHLLLSVQNPTGAPRYYAPMDLLHAAGCVAHVRDFDTRSYKSRTLPTLVSRRQTLELVKLKDESCLP